MPEIGPHGNRSLTTYIVENNHNIMPNETYNIDTSPSFITDHNSTIEMYMRSCLSVHPINCVPGIFVEYATKMEPIFPWSLFERIYLGYVYYNK